MRRQLHSVSKLVATKNTSLKFLCNCWLLAALASVSAGQKRRIYDMFSPSSYNPYGVYSVRFFIDGTPRYLVIDDLLPCNDDGQPIFSHSRDWREFWVCLLEKALAKLYGSYLAIDNGSALAGKESSVFACA